MTLYYDSSWKYYKYVTSSWSQLANPSGISSTSGWSNPSLSFDKNSETYSSCGTSSDYIEWNLGTEILLSGMSATGNYISSVARYCNVSIYKVNDDGSETLLGNGSGGSESATYTSSVSFDAVWVKRLRFRLIAGYSEPTTSYPTQIREITLTATQQRTAVETTKEDSDYAVYAGKKIRNRGANSGLFYAGNVIKKGSVVGGHDKHFSIPNKITLDDNGYFVTYKDGAQEVWRISIKFQLSNVNADQRLFGVVATTCCGVVIGVLNGKLNYWLSSDGVNWDIASRAVGLNTLTANTIYTLHFKRLKNTSGNYSYQCMLRSSVDNAWVNDIFISNATPIKSGFYYNLGRDWGIFTENATFYLDSDTHIIKGNSRGSETTLWSATSEGVVPVAGIKTAYTGAQRVYNLQSYSPSQVIYELGNPSATTTSAAIPIYRPGVYKIWLVSGGNSYRWCYIGCNYAGSGAGFIGKLKFNTKCHLRLIVGGQREDSLLQVAEWGNKSQWYNLVVATSSKDDWSADPRSSVGTIAVNRDSTFNNYFDIELESNGNGGSQSGYGASVYGGYGSGGTNGYAKLMYIGEN